MGKPYDTDVCDAVWAIIEPHLPAAKPGSWPRSTDCRSVINAGFTVPATVLPFFHTAISATHHGMPVRRMALRMTTCLHMAGASASLLGLSAATRPARIGGLRRAAESAAT